MYLALLAVVLLSACTYNKFPVTEEEKLEEQKKVKAWLRDSAPIKRDKVWDN